MDRFTGDAEGRENQGLNLSRIRKIRALNNLVTMPARILVLGIMKIIRRSRSKNDSNKKGNEKIKPDVARNASAESGASLENALLENNAEIAQARKTGKISKESKALAVWVGEAANAQVL